MTRESVQRDDVQTYFMRRIVEEWPELMAELGVPEERMAAAAGVLRELEQQAV